MTPEGKTKQAIDKLLKLFRAYALKPVQNGLGKPGVDYNGRHRGLAFLIEGKEPGKKPTPRQWRTLREHAGAGGSCFVIDGPGEDIRELAMWLRHPANSFWSI